MVSYWTGSLRYDVLVCDWLDVTQLIGRAVGRILLGWVRSPEA